MPTTTPDNAAATVTRALADHPNGTTVRDLAGAAGVSQSTVQKHLNAMESAGTAVRTPGQPDGTKRPADVWTPAPTPDSANAREATATDAPVAAPVSTPTASDAPVSAPPVPGPSASDAPVSGAPVSGAPVSGGPVSRASVANPDHLKVIMVAGVLGGHPNGISATDITDQSGLRTAIVTRVLTAMETAGAAVRHPASDDMPERWTRGEADLSTVDLANGSPYRVCTCQCGHTHRIRTGATAGTSVPRMTAGLGRNSDGQRTLGKNELRNMVEAFCRRLGPGHILSPGTVAKEIGGRSPGACRNAMVKLTGAGVLDMTNEAPELFTMADNPPAPSAEVLALMNPTAPDTDTDADDITDTDGTTATAAYAEAKTAA